MRDKSILTHAKRILILGPPGAGKSTLAEKIAKATGLPLIHLDHYFFGANWAQPNPETWRKHLEELVTQDTWVMEGQRNNLSLRTMRADVVIYLDLPLVLCLWRVVKRRLRTHHTPRSSKREDCPEVITWPFFKYALTFNAKRAWMLETIFEQPGDRQVIVLGSPNEVDAFEREELLPPPL